MIQNSNNGAPMNDSGQNMQKPITHNGPTLAILIIILIVILGGMYLWGGMLGEQPAEVTPLLNNEPETPRAKTDVEILGTLSPSDELGAIEADIQNTNLDSVESDMNTIDAEINILFAE